MDVWDIYKEIKGVSSLYDWQRDFLQDKHLIEKRQNFVLWLPTGAGKTLVAELLLLRECLVRRRNCILILPYVAIVQEKIISLAPLEERLGIVVEQYAASKGRFPPIKRRNSQSIYVCTIEKANALVNSLLEQGRLHEVGLAIVDELHMIGESGGRGAVLEQCICKMLYQRPSAFMQKSATEQKIQIVGMSATLGNPGELCAFLSARKFHTSFRPVQLVERIKLHDEIYQVDDEGSWQLEKKLPKNTIGRDPDGLVMLLGNLLKGQVLIFCPTKQNCENLCKLLADLCPISFREHRSAERKQILTQFLEENEGRVCSVLSAGIKHGVAYHHSGLTQDERLLVESAYKSGVISIICCTSTLAAGVNLPARRVIVRSPLVGRTPLKKSQYMQMIGRAGRKGLDEKGDSVVILHHGNEVKTFRRMQESPLEPCLSGLSDELQREAFFLDLIVLKICSTIDDLSSMLKNTLFGIQQQEKLDIRALAEQTIQSLVDKQMLIQPEAIYFATSIGKATFNANLNPQMALQMNRDLGENLSQGIVLSSHFHLLYNCVPLDIQVPNLDWNLFHNEYLKLSKEERSLIHAMGFPEGTIIQYILLPNNNKNSVKAQRLYVAFMLRQIWEQRPLWEVAQQFDVTRGWLQSTLQSAVSQSGSIVRFAERTPALWSLRSLLPEMVKRLSECTRQELIPLLAIECVKMGRARQLYEKNYRTVGSIARAELEKLMTAMDGKLNRQQAQRMINSAKNIIRDRIAEKTEELEQLGAGDVLMFSTPLLTAENDPNDISLSQNNASNGGSIQPQRMELNRSGLEEEAEEDDEAEEEKHGEEEEDKEEETTTTLFHQTKRKLNFNCSGLEPKEEN